MLDILDLADQLEVAEDIMHQQVLADENIGYKYKTIAKLAKKNW